MWRRKTDPGPPVVGIPDLDQEIRRLRDVIARGGATQAVGPLIGVLTAKATLAGMADRHDVVLEDRRAAAGLLRGFDGQPSPVDRDTELLVWMGLVAAERAAGHVDAALTGAVRAMERVGTVQSEDTEICAAFVVDLDWLRADFKAAKRRPEALSAAELASDLAARLGEVDLARYAEVLGIAWLNEAGARAQVGDVESAAALNEEAIRLLEEHVPDGPALATALANRANLQRRNGEWADAVTTERRLLAGVRASRPATRAEVERLNSLFITLVRAGRRDEAEQTIGEAIEVARNLAAADPSQRSLVATLLGNQANIRGELGRYADALVSSEQALALREGLAASEPSRETDQGLAMVLNNHAAVLRRLGRYAEAADSAARSVELRRRLAEDGAPNSLALLANSLNSHAEQLGRLGDGEHAVRVAEEARDLYAALPPPGAVKKFLRANQETLGRVLGVAGRGDEAVTAAALAVELGRAAAAEAPGELPELASCLESLADRLSEVGRTADAEAARTEAAQVRVATGS
jgi:hypothetical protein